METNTLRKRKKNCHTTAPQETTARRIEGVWVRHITGSGVRYITGLGTEKVACHKKKKYKEEDRQHSHT